MLVTHRDVWFTTGREQALNFGDRIAIQHEDLAEMCPGGAEEIEAIGFRLGERLLVAEDYCGGIIFDSAQSNKSSSFDLSMPPRNQEPLRIGVQGGLSFLQKDPLGG